MSGIRDRKGQKKRRTRLTDTKNGLIPGLRLSLLCKSESIFEEGTSGIKVDLTEDTLLKNIAAGLACHKSVRGSEHLNNEELTRMMADLDKAKEPDKCPHGRPTRIYLSLDDLNKMFKRK